MELLCPHCLKRVTVPDEKAGQILNCPLCAGAFAAPSLAPVPARASAPAYSPPAPPPAPPPPPPVAPDKPAAAPTPAEDSAFAEPLAPAPRPAPAPAPPPADYKRELAFRVRPDILVWVPPVVVFLLIFIFSFFTWHDSPDPVGKQMLWQLAFGEFYTAVFLAYLILLLFLTLPISVVCLLFEQRWVPAPPPLAVLMPWKSGLTFALLLLTFLLLFYDYQQGVLNRPSANPIDLAEKIAFRLHFLALLASGLELWAQSRRLRHLPLPRFALQL